MTFEFFNVGLTHEQLDQWAKAQKIEFRVCRDEKTLDAQMMKNIQDFIPALDKELAITPAGPAKPEGHP